MNEIVSVVVPVYKVEKYLDRCVTSILGQSYKDLEILLVDDGSPDNCGLLCDQWASKDKRIKVIHKANGGLSSARNAGIEKSTGRYLFFVDSDDWITSDAISSLMEIEKKSDADIVSGSYVITSDPDFTPVQSSDYSIMNREDALEYYLKIGMSQTISDYPAWGKLYRRELFNEENFPEGQLYEDVATVFKLIKKVKKYVKSKKVIYFYYKNESSITHNSFTMKDLDAIKVGEDLVKESAGEAEIISKLAEQKRVRGYFSCICKMYMYGIDKSVEQPEQIEKMCVNQLRKNYSILFKSQMPISRKIVLTSICISPAITKRILSAKGGNK